MSDRQKTLAAAFQLSGVGIHSGQETTLQCLPAPENSGIVFEKGKKQIPALIQNITDTKRGTSLGGILVVEHLLSAFFALGVDNVRIKVSGAEIPAMDGSSQPFVEAIQSAGIKEQSSPKTYIELSAPIRIEEKDAKLEALPYSGFMVDFMVNFSPVGTQKLVFDLQKGDYAGEIAPARTFGCSEEIEALKQQGLGRGASLENSLVLNQSGYINLPRFKDELVRHKILDLIGDLALLGRPLRAKIKAVKSGHKMNAELVRRILNNG
ncbi:MAG: UDP-3-O-acyl-N-acetylglucosamine deacetylase [Candidatus Margulisbacteria bacterium]|nr:UDP-3-O-acyl-N-acetylglucosamine deacetylase [Candidatus Margulisiibacteriota bacterium]